MVETDPHVSAAALTTFGTRFLTAMGCAPTVAVEVAEHLVEADLAGVYSHGIFRLSQYADNARTGIFAPEGEAVLSEAEGGGPLVNGGNGFGIPALRLATDTAIDDARAGAAAVGVMNVGHTGRIGAYAEHGANAGCLTIILGGGSREQSRQVAPYGGARAVLPTNPYAFGIPGGEHGPVVFDFATAAGAGGKAYAARSSGRPLPEGLCIDASGAPTTDPEDYFNGGALLPMAGPKGYGMAIVAELLGEAIYGQAMDGMNWICVCIDLGRFKEASAYSRAAEVCLAELRTCPPAPGFDRVEVPGERERRLRTERLKNGIPIPPATLAELKGSAIKLGIDSSGLEKLLN